MLGHFAACFNRSGGDFRTIICASDCDGQGTAACRTVIIDRGIGEGLGYLLALLQRLSLCRGVVKFVGIAAIAIERERTIGSLNA